jgi:uncharacterized RDD family membrane protein YckC
VAFASISSRFGALIIDAVIVFVSLIVAGAIMNMVDPTGSSETRRAPAATAVSLIWFLLAISYHPACWYVFEGTPGQRMLGMRVVKAQNGQSLGFGATTLRYIIFAVVTLVFPVGIISGFMASEDPAKRAWHDEAAGSIVVKKL